jgi:hypothetical protein
MGITVIEEVLGEVVVNVTPNAPITVATTTPTPVVVNATPSIGSVLNITESPAVVLNHTTTSVVTVNIPALQGPPGEPVPEYTKRFDEVSDVLYYKGEALPGTLESAPLWRIRRIDVTDGGNDITERFATGVSEFIHVWNNRASLIYS